jgi:hypothetical protein
MRSVAGDQRHEVLRAVTGLSVRRALDVVQADEPVAELVVASRRVIDRDLQAGFERAVLRCLDTRRAEERASLTVEVRDCLLAARRLPLASRCQRRHQNDPHRLHHFDRLSQFPALSPTLALLTPSADAKRSTGRALSEAA